MRIPFAQIDAFSDTPFGGNQAAVMPLSAWLDDDVLLDIAQENNLSETAFIVASDDEGVDFDLRWFTPGAEVALCGHATLASGHFVLSSDTALDRVRFRTRQAGMLEVARADSGYTLELLAWGPSPEAIPEIVAALNRHRKFIRGRVAPLIDLKYAPEIRFFVDDTFEEAGRIDALLRSDRVKRDLDDDSDDSNEG